jgi:hypothetical protein
MRHSTRKLTDGFHLLRLSELLACLAQLPSGVAENSFGTPSLRSVGRQEEARDCYTEVSRGPRRKAAHIGGSTARMASGAAPGTPIIDRRNHEESGEIAQPPWKPN